jgi:glycosyltransferase involved in cell wall biosynthesis
MPAKRALVIAPQPFFTPRGTPLSVYYRTLVTAEAGVEVDLLTYGEGADPDIPGVRVIRIPRFRILGPVKTGPSALKAFLDVFLVVWTFALLLRQRYDFVHAHEEAVFFAAFMKPLFRFRLVYDMHSSLPEQLTNFGFTRSRLLTSLFTWLEHHCLAKADAVITICPALAAYVETLLGDASGKHVLIENSIFEPVRLKGANADEKARCSCAQLPAGRRIVYAGTLEPYQGIDILLRAFAMVAASHPDSVLVVAGGSSQQVERYRKMAGDLGIERCLFPGRVSTGEARWLNSTAHILVSPRLTGSNTPLKIYEQIASGVPLVATDIYSHTQVLSGDVAILVPPDAAGLASGLLQLLDDPELGVRIAAKAQALYARDYSRPVYEQKMARLLELVG